MYHVTGRKPGKALQNDDLKPGDLLVSAEQSSCGVCERTWLFFVKKRLLAVSSRIKYALDQTPEGVFF